MAKKAPSKYPANVVKKAQAMTAPKDSQDWSSPKNVFKMTLERYLDRKFISGK